jgi:NTE family protein
MKKIGLTLSGGGARGAIHLGVLQALSELGVNVDIISGASAGGIIGAFHAAGFQPEEMLEIAKELGIGLFNPFHVSLLGDGMMSMNGFKSVFEKHLPKNFEDLKIPLYVATTDVVANRSQYFNQGPLTPVLLATACVQVLFETQEYAGYLLHDGGILDNLPTAIIREKCDLLIGVHTNSIDPTDSKYSKPEIMDRTFHMAIEPGVRRSLATCDLQLEPPSMSRFGMFDLRDLRTMMAVGYDYTMSRKDDVLALQRKAEE